MTVKFFYFLICSNLQEGFLLGTVEENQIEVISDSNEGSINPETVIREYINIFCMLQL
jgi:hypothetical protein